MKQILKLKRLDAKGFSHDLLIGAFVLVFAVAGVGYLVASHADTPTIPAPSSGTWKYLGTANLPKQNQAVAAWACKQSTSATIWRVTGYFGLQSSYKVANSWEALINNDGQGPFPGGVSGSYANGYFNDAVNPAVSIKLNVYKVVNNYLRFGYFSSNGSISGQIVSNIRVGDLPTC